MGTLEVDYHFKMMGILAIFPHQCTYPPQEIAGLMIRVYLPLVSLNKVIYPLFLGSVARIALIKKVKLLFDDDKALLRKWVKLAIPNPKKNGKLGLPGGIYSSFSRGELFFSPGQWLFLVPVKGGRWHIIPQLAVYTTYILPSGGLYSPYHLLGEPETTIEGRFFFTRLNLFFLRIFQALSSLL